MTDIGDLDLNLLAVFEALMAERSVTRAARRLGVGQPAASGARARLRALLGDELFVRGPRGMEPTARAEAMARGVLPGLAAIRAGVAGAAPFDPATARRGFVVSGGDHAGMVVLPDLVRRVRARAPGVDLRYRFIEKDAALALLDAGETDLALGVFPDLPQHLAGAPVLGERFVCLTARDHPAAGRLDLDAYLRWPHLLVTERGDARGAVDDALRARGLVRRVALTAPHVLLVPALLPGTDLIVTTGARAAAAFAASGGLAVHEPPLPLAPWRLLQVWQRRRTGEPGLAWLRAQLPRAEGRARTAGRPTTAEAAVPPALAPSPDG